MAVIDPGPDRPEHVAALLDALRGETVTHQIVTHTHIDHSPAAAAVKRATGAPTYGFGPHGAALGPAVEEGGDRDFIPDVRLADGGKITKVRNFRSLEDQVGEIIFLATGGENRSK